MVCLYRTADKGTVYFKKPSACNTTKLAETRQNQQGWPASAPYRLACQQVTFWCQSPNFPTFYTNFPRICTCPRRKHVVQLCLHRKMVMSPFPPLQSLSFPPLTILYSSPFNVPSPPSSGRWVWDCSPISSVGCLVNKLSAANIDVLVFGLLPVGPKKLVW